jgi:L-asparaginase
MLQKIIILGTGGTIAGLAADPSQAHRYQAGQVGIEDLWARSASRLHGFEVLTEQIAQIDSKDMDEPVWRALLERCMHHLSQTDVAGLVIAHGTDTLEETGFFLSALVPADKPVVLTGAMRAANDPDADGPENLADAVGLVAGSGLRGVCVAFAGQVHAASWVQKVHASDRDAFASTPHPILGRVTPTGYEGERYSPPPKGRWPTAAQVLQATVWPRVEWLNSHALARPWLIRALIRPDSEAPPVRGVVVAGTGAGTVHVSMTQALAEWVSTGGEVWISTRCWAARLTEEDQIPGTTVPWTPAQARVGLMLSLITGAR